MIPAICSTKKCHMMLLPAAPTQLLRRVVVSENVKVVQLEGRMVMFARLNSHLSRVNKKRCACTRNYGGLQRLQKTTCGRGWSSLWGRSFASFIKQGLRAVTAGQLNRGKKTGKGIREGAGQAVAVLSEKAPGETSVSDRLPCLLVEAVTNEQLQAAATLRSCCFYSYPPGRSPIAAERHRRMKAEDELKVLQRKVRGAEPGFKRVACLIALCLDADAALRIALDRTCQLPFEDGNACVLGTLDVNMGLRLVGEELVGIHPPGPDAEFRRAYLSNVCVAEVARRRGVAFALIEEACIVAQCWGVEYLYVHVVAENLPATELYFRSGFTLEREESPALSRMLSRPRRLLLRRLLTTF